MVRAQNLGAKTVLERGSSHITYQNRLLAEEGEIWGVPLPQTHPIIWERELQGYELCDRVCVPSRFAEQTFLSMGFPASKILSLPLGTSLKEFYPVPKADDTFRIVHAGMLNLRKGIPYLLQAFFELKLPKAELWLLGSIEPEILPFLQKYRCDSIVWQGKQPQSRLHWFYSQCSVFTLVSVEDGFGVVIPQAMACGLPVIHTPHTGGPDIVRDGIDGFCVPIRDVAALKEKILFLYENPDRLREMSQNALQRAQTALSWEQYGERAIAAYQSLLLPPENPSSQTGEQT
ncbi:MAG: glycosyltransferase family 4 protein [Pseudanabaenaceae cyanobacterium]